MVGAATTRVRLAAGAVRRSCQRVIVMAAHVMAASARTIPVVSAAKRIACRALGRILATITAAPRMSATAAMPAPWPPELLQHDGLHMIGRLRVGSVDHATHLISRMATGGVLWLAGLEGGRPPGPAPAYT